MKSKLQTSIISATLLVAVNVSPVHAAPPVTGVPVIDSPKLLDFTRDSALREPDLTEPTNNRLQDLHGSMSNCDSMDLVLSTAGNYHMALQEMFQTLLLPRYGQYIKSWVYTTSPPIATAQVLNKHVGFGNFSIECKPSVVVAPMPEIKGLQKLEQTEGAPFPVFKNRGNVLLVKKGNPKHIHTVWDLGRADVSVVTANPYNEQSTFANYSGTIYNIAVNDPNPPGGWTADRLFNSIFNAPPRGNERDEHGMRHDRAKWYIGARIHHRETPWSVAYGHADAGVLFYHLALNAVRTFPDLFEIVPLGGTVENPMPLPGNNVGTHYGIRIAGSWTSNQLFAREKLIETYASPEFTDILARHGMDRF